VKTTHRFESDVERGMQIRVEGFPRAIECGFRNGLDGSAEAVKRQRTFSRCFVAALLYV
jgi:hypothetical protein